MQNIKPIKNINDLVILSLDSNNTIKHYFINLDDLLERIDCLFFYDLQDGKDELNIKDIKEIKKDLKLLNGLINYYEAEIIEDFKDLLNDPQEFARVYGGI